MIDPSTLGFDQLEQQNGLPPGLLTAVMHQESGGNPNAVSKAGAKGLFQFMDPTAAQYGIDPLDPQQAANGAAKMYGDLSKKYNGDVPKMLAAYNWGQGNLDKHGLDNAPDETRKYISGIQGRLGTQVADSGQIQSDALPEGFILDDHIAALPAGFQLDSATAKPQDDSFLGGMKENAKGAVQNIKDLVQGNFAGGSGAISSPKTNALADKLFPQGTGASSLSDAAGDFLYNLTRNTSPSDFSSALLEKFGQNPAGKVVNIIGGLNPTYNAAGTAISKYVNPAIEKQTGIDPDNLALLEMGAGTLGLKKAGTITDPLANVAKSVFAKKTPPVTAADLSAQASTAYADATQKGGTISPTGTDAWLQGLDNLKAKPIAGKVLTSEDAALNKHLSEFDGLKGQPLSLEDAQRIDESLGNKIDGLLENGRVTKAAKPIVEAQKQFRDMIENLNPNQITGGTAGFEALKQGRDLWSRSMKMRDIEKIVTRAQSMDNPVMGLKTGFRNMINNDKKLRGFTTEERGLIKKAANTGIVTNALRLAGSRLGPIAAGASGFATGGPLGAAAAYSVESLLSGAARTAANKIQLAKANKVTNAIARGKQAKVGVPALMSHAAAALPNSAAAGFLAALQQQQQMRARP